VSWRRTPRLVEPGGGKAERENEREVEMTEARRRDLKLQEVDEKQASPEVKDLYDRIKDVLQSNVVSSAWQVFASKPTFLSAVWNELEPAVDRGFLEAADGIRALAIERVGEGQKVADHRPLLGGDLARAVEELGVFLEVNPKLLIVLCALRRSWSGQPVGGAREAAPSDRGIPPWQPEPTLGREGPVKEVFAEMADLLDLPAPNMDYRVLAKWPNYLKGAWVDLRSYVGNEAWRKACVTIDWVAEQVAVALPAKISVSPDRAQDLGLEKEEIDEVGGGSKRSTGSFPDSSSIRRSCGSECSEDGRSCRLA
jgi:halocarboxylic acid dehydrogenase DehI